MKTLKIYLGLALAVSAFVLFSFILLRQEQKKTAPRCLEPHLKTIPSPMPQKNPRSVTPNNTRLAVPDWWKPQLNNEQQVQYKDIMDKQKFYTAGDVLVHNNQVWIAHYNGLVRFDTTQRIIKTYQIPTDSQLEDYNFVALYLQNGEIWALLSSAQSALAKYDSAKDVFTIIHDKDGLLNRVHNSTIGDISSLIGELSDGRLVFILGGEIFSYDPANQKAKKLLDSKSGYIVATIAISRDDTIWFTTERDYVIRSLNPATGRLKGYGKPPSLVRDNENQSELAMISSKAITVDGQGRLWVGYFDRLESDGNGNYVWHELKRPTIFVDDTHINETFDYAVYVYKWTSVFSVKQFSDETIWFVTGVGAAQYDATQDFWCWSTTQPFRGIASSPIAEDENGDIWMVVDDSNQIYKLER